MVDIYIDFDGTITDPDVDFATAVERDPQPGCVDAINALYNAGHEITIYSCRSNPEVVGNIKRKMLTQHPTTLEKQWVARTLEEEMIAYLRVHKIPFHNVVKNKPYYQIIIDDRSFNPKQGWTNILNEIPH